MKTLQELKPGQSFYYPNSRGIIYIFIEHQYRQDGNIKCCKAVLEGKLYPIYMKPTNEVEVLSNFKS